MKLSFALVLSLAAASTASCFAESDASQAAPTVTPPRVIQADLRSTPSPTSRMFRECIGAGRAHEALRGDWQRQLKLCRDELGFKFIRFHGLFHDDMGVCARDEKERLSFNWQYIDMVFDYLQSIGMKPFVELTFMPNAIASGKKTVFWWKGNVTLPADFKDWEELVRRFTEHVTERYGTEEVKSWYFEVWNEPNHHSFWAATKQDYFEMYRVTTRAIKAVNPAYRVGGPATAGTAWVKDTLEFCAQQNLPLDFISTHIYNVAGDLDEFGTKQLRLMPNLRFVAEETHRMRREIKASKLSGVELHITEWSSSYSPKDPVHDDYFSVPFILEQIKRSGNVADSLSYWVFTDIFEEACVPATPFHGGFGLLNLQGIKKPAYFAFKFLNELGGEEFMTADPAAYVCREKNGAVQALFWDLTHPFPDGKTLNKPGFLRVRPSAPKADALVRLEGRRQVPAACLQDRVRAQRRLYGISQVGRAGKPDPGTGRQAEVSRDRCSGRGD